MNFDQQFLGFVMAGGTGSRLQPLTAQRCKPALPFGVRHRVVDFVLANFFNSGLHRTRLLVQYRPDCLAEHVRRVWSGGALANGAARLEVVGPRPGDVFRGTADAVAKNLHLVHALRPRLVAVFGADHAYRMDVRQMIDFHLAERADVTVATLPVPLAEARAFGIVETDARQRVRAFQEKPADPVAAPAHPGHAQASMGNYLFSADVLCDVLARLQDQGGTDFGHDVLPTLLRSHRVMAYDFQANRVPGQPSRRDGADGTALNYWRDIGSIGAYFQAQLDTLGPAPRLPLQNLAWPIAATRACHGGPAAELHRAEVFDSQLGAGVSIDAARLRRVIAGAGSLVERGAELTDSILMDRTRVGAGARLRRVIVDEDNAIPDGEVIGHDAQHDRARFPVSDDGIVVVPRGHFGARAEGCAERGSDARADARADARTDARTIARNEAHADALTQSRPDARAEAPARQAWA